MAISEAQFLTPNSAAAIASNLFGPATNMLSNALNNAVESGRRMVDLQSHQEDVFLSEREKLRLATERKGLEAQRIFEADRTFGENVLRDRRDFSEKVFQDRRDFSESQSRYQDALGMQGARLGLDTLRTQSDLLKDQAQMDYWKANAGKGGVGGPGGRARAVDGGGSFTMAVNDVLGQTGGVLPLSMEAPVLPSGRVLNSEDIANQIRATAEWEQGESARGPAQTLFGFPRDQVQEEYEFLDPAGRDFVRNNWNRFQTKQVAPRYTAPAKRTDIIGVNPVDSGIR